MITLFKCLCKAKLILVAIHGGIHNDDDDAENVLQIMNWLWKMWRTFSV